MVRASRGIIGDAANPACRVEAAKTLPVKSNGLLVRLECTRRSHFHALVAFHTEVLSPVTAVAIPRIAASRDWVRDNPIIGVHAKRFLDPIVAVKTVLLGMTIGAICFFILRGRGMGLDITVDMRIVTEITGRHK